MDQADGAFLEWLKKRAPETVKQWRRQWEGGQTGPAGLAAAHARDDDRADTAQQQPPSTRKILVSVNPVTKAPTAFAAPEGYPHITEGPYQNVAEVSEEWVEAERNRLGDRILSRYEEWSRYPERIAEATAAERARCAAIARRWAKGARLSCEASAAKIADAIAVDIEKVEG